MLDLKFTWKYVKQLSEVEDVERHGPKVTGHDYNRYSISLHDWVPNPVTGEMGNTFYAENPKDALDQLGYYQRKN